MKQLHDFGDAPELRNYSRQRSGEVKRDVPVNLVWKIPVPLVVRFGRLAFTETSRAKRFVFEQLNQVLHARRCGFVHPKTYHNFGKQHQDPQTDARILIRQFLLTQGPHVSSHVTCVFWRVVSLDCFTEKSLFLASLFPRRQSRRISFGDNGLPFELTNNEFVTVGAAKSTSRWHKTTQRMEAEAMRHYYSSNNLGGSWVWKPRDPKSTWVDCAPNT